MQPIKVLDLFCGAGGAAVGISQAADTVMIDGIDINPQPEYPFVFTQADIADVEVQLIQEYDFVWASPPCQRYSIASRHHRNRGREYPDLVGLTRELLDKAGVPYCMENVPGAPIRRDLMLCGEMFGINVIRHRNFELSGFTARQPEHIKHRGLVKDGYYCTVAGNGGNDNGHNYTRLRGRPFISKLETWQHAMGISWINNVQSLRESVPPVYSRYIFREFLYYMSGEEPPVTHGS